MVRFTSDHACVRACVHASVCIGGARFLVQTINLEAILLNAVALEFILGIDNVLLSTYGTAQLKQLLGDLEELPVRQRHSFQARAA